jgi:queuosine precursor transporter
MANLFLVIVILIAQWLPGAPFWDGQAAFERILGFSPRILAGSFLGYLIGSYANAYIMKYMKNLTKGRFLWARTIGSTFVGEGLDSWLFLLIAFVGTTAISDIFSAALTTWLLKTLYEIIVTPLTYFVIIRIKNYEVLE